MPQGYFSVATFQEPGWRTEGKKTLGLEMAEPAGDRLEPRRWELPDVIVYPTGGGTGVVGMAKAFDELEALGLVGPDRPRMICVQSEATAPIVRAFQSGEADITPAAPGTTLATGLNVAQNVGHINVLRILRETGGHAPGGLRRGDPRGDPRRVGRAAVRLVSRGSGDARGPARAGGPGARSAPGTGSSW